LDGIGTGTFLGEEDERKILRESNIVLLCGEIEDCAAQEFLEDFYILIQKNIDTIDPLKYRDLKLKTCLKKALERLGSPTWYFDKAIYAYPLQMAVKLNLPLVIYGEDTNFLYGGPNTEETPSAMKQITNDVVKPVPWDVWIDNDVAMKDVNPGIFPTEKEIKK
jgi:hypothetical protein